MYGYNQQIIQVSGENGARAYQMPPNSNALLLDDKDPIVWLVTTDGAGYKSSIKPFKLEPYTPPEPVTLNDIMNRLEQLENKINEPYITEPEPEPIKSNTEPVKPYSKYA